MNYAERQKEIANLVNDAYLAGYQFARGEAPPVPYSMDLKELRKSVDKSLRHALREMLTDMGIQPKDE